MAVSTTYTVEQCLAATRATIQARGIPSGLEEIRRHVERLLANPTLLQDSIGNPAPYRDRTTIGYDPETDVHVLVHGREKGGQSAPHDHGPCWVVYGQYKHYTDMRRWKRLDNGNTAGHAELIVQKQFRLNEGEATAFARGDIHSISYSKKRCVSTWKNRPSRSKTARSVRGSCLAPSPRVRGQGVRGPTGSAKALHPNPLPVGEGKECMSPL